MHLSVHTHTPHNWTPLVHSKTHQHNLKWALCVKLLADSIGLIDVGHDWHKFFLRVPRPSKERKKMSIYVHREWRGKSYKELVSFMCVLGWWRSRNSLSCNGLSRLIMLSLVGKDSKCSLSFFLSFFLSFSPSLSLLSISLFTKIFLSFNPCPLPLPSPLHLEQQVLLR